MKFKLYTAFQQLSEMSGLIDFCKNCELVQNIVFFYSLVDNKSVEDTAVECASEDSELGSDKKYLSGSDSSLYQPDVPSSHDSYLFVVSKNKT